MKNSNSERDVPQRGDRRKHKCLKAKAKETKNAKKNNGGGKERVSSCKEKKEKKCPRCSFVQFYCVDELPQNVINSTPAGTCN